MSTKKYTPMLIWAAIAGAAGALLFNYIILTNIIIPDPCYYHAHDTSVVFDLFYVMTAADGYHPSPSVFNVLFTIVTGACMGSFIYLYFFRKRKQKLAE